MKAILLLLIISVCWGNSMLVDVDKKKTSTDERYLLKIDENPKHYYVFEDRDRLTVDFYHTVIMPACEEKLGKHIKVNKTEGDLPVLSLSMPLPDRSAVQVLPFDPLFMIKVQPKNYKKIFEKRFPEKHGADCIGPVKLNLYRAKKHEDLVFTFPEKVSNVLVRRQDKLFCVEVYGQGYTVENAAVDEKFKFIKTIAWGSMVTDSLMSEGVSYFDFKIKRKTDVQYEFVNRTLKVRFKKG